MSKSQRSATGNRVTQDRGDVVAGQAEVGAGRSVTKGDEGAGRISSRSTGQRGM